MDYFRFLTQIDMDLPGWQVAVVAAAVVVTAICLMYLRPPPRVLARVMVVVAAFVVVGTVAIGAIDLRILRSLCSEDSYIEWISAFCLLATAGVCMTTFLMLRRQGRPSPLVLVVGAGCAWAGMRELEFGAPLFGHQIWYSRSLFDPEAYYTLSYYESLKEMVGLSGSAVLLYVAHLFFFIVAVGLISMVAWTLWTGQKRLASDFRRWWHTAAGKMLLVGVGCYVLAQIGGKLFRKVLDSQMAASWRPKHLVHRVAEEPTEFIGALCIFLAAMMIWQASRCFIRVRPAFLARRPVAGPVAQGQPVAVEA